MAIVLIVLLAVALSAGTYWWLENLGARAWVPFMFRAVAWCSLGLLLINVSCPAPGPVLARPLVLLDGSLSLTSSAGRWQEARDSAERWGDVRLFGDERAVGDTAPDRGRSNLAPALIAALAGDRPVLVVSDGEIEDVQDLPADLVARAGVRLFPRREARDIAVTLFEGPARVTAGDSIALDVELRAHGGSEMDTVRVEIRSEQAVLLSRPVILRGGSGSLHVTLPTKGLAAGEHLLRAQLTGHPDGEPRDDARLLLLNVTATPGVVLLASPADWDSRFLYRTLKDVAQLPVRGYVRVENGRWRRMDDLSTVSADEVRQAAHRADLLVAKGTADELIRGSRARGLLRWPSGESGETLIPGDWYLSAGGASPVAGAFAGAPVDSFPPAIQITPIEPSARDWVGLTAQEGRRGVERPVMIGRDSAGTRRVTVAADGLWRWAFRGGSSEQAYRSWVASTTSWLLGGTDSVTGRARPVRAVVQNSRPVTFEWAAPGPPEPLRVMVDAEKETRQDTLQFDGAGRAQLWLPVGHYHYRLEGGGAGTIAVEEYSDEWLPRTVTLAEHPAAARQSYARTSARQWVWLFGVCVLALSGEWLMRRRLGLR
jgi:hypothetical protein